jgi:hypothetical protein
VKTYYDIVAMLNVQGEAWRSMDPDADLLARLEKSLLLGDGAFVNKHMPALRDVIACLEPAQAWYDALLRRARSIQEWYASDD